MSKKTTITYKHVWKGTQGLGIDFQPESKLKIQTIQAPIQTKKNCKGKKKHIRRPKEDKPNQSIKPTLQQQMP